MDARMPLRAAGTAACVLAAATLAGCSPSFPAGLPDGVSISVQQNRPDTAERRIQVRITNDTKTPLTISKLSFESPQFSEAVTYPRAPATIRPGGITDLPILLAEPSCDSDDLTATVAIEFTVDDGHQLQTTVTPADPLGQLPGISARDCLDTAIAELAEIADPPELRVVEISGRQVAMLDLTVTPAGASGILSIDSVEDTVLLGLIDQERGVVVESLPLDISINGEGPRQTLTIPILALRGEAHSVADDKRGTIFPLRVTVDGTEGISYFAVSNRLKVALYSFIQGSCARQ